MTTYYCQTFDAALDFDWPAARLPPCHDHEDDRCVTDLYWRRPRWCGERKDVLVRLPLEVFQLITCGLDRGVMASFGDPTKTRAVEDLVVPAIGGVVRGDSGQGVPRRLVDAAGADVDVAARWLADLHACNYSPATPTPTPTTCCPGFGFWRR